MTPSLPTMRTATYVDDANPSSSGAISPFTVPSVWPCASASLPGRSLPHRPAKTARPLLNEAAHRDGDFPDPRIKVGATGLEPATPCSQSRCATTAPRPDEMYDMPYGVLP